MAEVSGDREDSLSSSGNVSHAEGPEVSSSVEERLQFDRPVLPYGTDGKTIIPKAGRLERLVPTELSRSSTSLFEASCAFEASESQLSIWRAASSMSLPEGQDAKPPSNREWLLCYIACDDAGKLSTMLKRLNNDDELVKRDHRGRSLVHNAVVANSPRALKALLTKEVIGFNSRDSQKLTPLHYACFLGHCECIKCLIAARVEANVTDAESRTPLMLAVTHVNVSSCLVMITELALSPTKDSCSLNFKQIDSHQRGLLHYLALSGINDKLTIAGYFLQQGLDIKARDRDGYTPLHYAVVTGDIRLVQKFLDIAPECLDIPNYDGVTCVMTAIASCNMAMIALMLAEAATAQLHRTDMTGWSCLHYACKHGLPTVVAMLEEFHVDTLGTDDNGYTPLLIAAYHGHSACVELLLDGIFYSDCTFAGENVLHLAVLSKNVEVVKQILAEYHEEARDHVLGSLNHNGYAPIHLCTRGAGNEAILEALLVGGSEERRKYLELEAEDGSRSIHYAVAQNLTRMVATLISRGADINARDSKGKTPLFHAIIGGSMEFVDLITSHGGEINTKDDHGFTPIFYAVDFNHFEILHYLLNHGGDPNIYINDPVLNIESTVLDHACMLDRRVCVSILQNNMAHRMEQTRDRAGPTVMDQSYLEGKTRSRARKGTNGHRRKDDTATGAMNNDDASNGDDDGNDYDDDDSDDGSDDDDNNCGDNGRAAESPATDAEGLSFLKPAVACIYDLNDKGLVEDAEPTVESSSVHERTARASAADGAPGGSTAPMSSSIGNDGGSVILLRDFMQDLNENIENVAP